jgi:hypothetical protein
LVFFFGSFIHIAYLPGIKGRLSALYLCGEAGSIHVGSTLKFHSRSATSICRLYSCAHSSCGFNQDTRKELDTSSSHAKRICLRGSGIPSLTQQPVSHTRRMWVRLPAEV